MLRVKALRYLLTCLILFSCENNVSKQETVFLSIYIPKDLYGWVAVYEKDSIKPNNNFDIIVDKRGYAFVDTLKFDRVDSTRIKGINRIIDLSSIVLKFIHFDNIKMKRRVLIFYILNEQEKRKGINFWKEQNNLDSLFSTQNRW